MTPEALPDVANVAAEARGYANLATSFLSLADRLVEERRLIDAAFCYRAAEFFLLPGDARRDSARFLDLVRQAYGIRREHMASVPIADGKLPVYGFGTPRKGAVASLVGEYGLKDGLQNRQRRALPFMRSR